MHRICVSEKIVEVSENFLIRTYQEHSEIIGLVAFKLMYGERICRSLGRYEM